MERYYERVVDAELKERLGSAGAVLIKGPKGCGKTETARRVANSELRVDESERVRQAMEIDPKMLLRGASPRLIDEWQEQPALWNHVRREVDDRDSPGQFVLTGSANPDESAKMHSGVGRFSVMLMRPMTLWERGWSSGEVSFASLMDGDVPESDEHPSDVGMVADWICIGGWPRHIGMGAAAASRAMRDNVELIAEVDLSRVGSTRRDPSRIRRLLASLARNVSTEASLAAFSKDAGADMPLAYETVRGYMDALDRIMVLENLPAWSTRIRSAAALRKSPKIHFVDPSLAVAALGIDAPRLADDPGYLGMLFESLAVRDLRVYAEAAGARLFHYRDSAQREVDAVAERRDGSWAAFEIKLGFGAVDAAIGSLLSFAANIDTQESGRKMLSLNVITGSGFAARHPSGVNIVPLQALRP